jgi:trimethylamine---corrinoid protein Co-methyltransferase
MAWAKGAAQGARTLIEDPISETDMRRTAGTQDESGRGGPRAVASRLMDDTPDAPEPPGPPGGPRRRPRRAAPGLAQLPWRRLVNPFRPVEILSADQVETIHRASLRILAEIGVEVLGDRALDALAGAGATVDRLARNVRLDPAHVETLVATAPSTFELHARNPERNVVFGGANLVFGAVGGPAFVSDLDRGRRAGNFADFVDYVRIIGAIDVIHQEGGGPLEPNDLPVSTRHLDMYRTFAVELDKTWQCLGFGARPVDDALEVACLIRDVDRDVLLREPSLMTVINTNSPLRLDGPMGDGLMEMALHGQPVVATPFTLAGAMSPVSLAGALAQQNAEALFLVALSQIVRPGAPMVYGAFTSNVDMRTGAPAFGTPESVKGALASGQMARRYGLPWRSSNTTASNVVDAQAAYESEMAVWGAVMGGVNLLYQGAGWLEGGLTASYEKLVIDAEILQMMSEVLQPLVVDEASLGFEAIADVGPGGHFFGTAHTLERYETAFYRPLLSDWRNFETWQADGALTATQRANTIWKRLLAEAVPPALDPAVVDALDAFVARRKREIERAG